MRGSKIWKICLWLKCFIKAMIMVNKMGIKKSLLSCSIKVRTF